MAKPHYHVESFKVCQSVGYFLRRLNSQVIPRVEALFTGTELTFTQWVTLMLLRDGVATTSTEIARNLNHDTGAMTRLIDQLERNGLIARARSADDRRVVRLSLTPQGKAVTKACSARVVNFWNGLLGDFSQQEFETLLSLLARLSARAESEADLPAAPPKRARSSR